MTKDRLIAVRDPHGFRPLALGRLGRRATVVVLRDLRDGSDRRDLRARRRAGRGARDQRRRACGRSSRFRRRRSRTASSSTSTSRGPTATCSARASTRSGPSSAACWRASSRVDADVVVPVPDSGVCAAMGYRGESGMPLRMGLIRNHYVGRTFIQPQAVDPALRRQGEAEPGAEHPRRQARRARGRLDRARHDEPEDRARWCAPRAPGKCTCASAARRRSRRASTASTRRAESELIAATHTLEEITKYLDADSVGYLSLEGLLTRGRQPSAARTAARATPGIYPVRVPARRGDAICSSR